MQNTHIWKNTKSNVKHTKKYIIPHTIYHLTSHHNLTPPPLNPSNSPSPNGLYVTSLPPPHQ